jgi:TPR repeat protein
MRLLLLLLASLGTLLAQTPSEEISRLNPTDLQARAQRGDPEAQWRLASVLRSTNFPGYKQDYGESLKWMRKAHEQGYLPATLGLGDAHQHGWSVARDSSTALRFYREAASKGFAPAQSMLGRIYLNGTGVSPNKSEGLKWMNLAINQRDMSAPANLGYYTENGLCGLRKDKVQAAAYYAVAIEFGAKGGPETRLEELKALLSPEQKAEAIKRAKALLAAAQPAKEAITK